MISFIKPWPWVHISNTLGQNTKFSSSISPVDEDGGPEEKHLHNSKLLTFIMVHL